MHGPLGSVGSLGVVLLPTSWLTPKAECACSDLLLLTYDGLLFPYLGSEGTETFSSQSILHSSSQGTYDSFGLCSWQVLLLTHGLLILPQ